jgi:hypothetical protein
LGIEIGGQLHSPSEVAGALQADPEGLGDRRIHATDTRYGGIHFKHILLPVWMSAFRFRDKVYRFVVNGRTGEVQGERPYSAGKIAFAIVLAAALIGGGFAAWRHYQADRVSVDRTDSQYRLR